MGRILTAYIAAGAVLLALDMVWLGLVARNFYRSEMGGLMTGQINITAAAAFYLLFVAGLTIFVILPALDAGSWRHALLYGALFGFFAYMTYDLTGLAVIRDFPARLALVDIAWGACISALAGVAGTMAGRWVG